MIKLYAEGPRLMRERREPLTADSQEAVRAKFYFDREWDGLRRIVRFERRAFMLEAELTEAGGWEAAVPWEALRGRGSFTVAVYGADDSVKREEGQRGRFLATNAVKIPVRPSGLALPDGASQGLIAQSFLKVQSDWAEEDEASAAYVKNKPDFEGPLEAVKKQVEQALEADEGTAEELKGMKEALERYRRALSAYPTSPLTKQEVGELLEAGGDEGGGWTEEDSTTYLTKAGLAALCRFLPERFVEKEEGGRLLTEAEAEKLAGIEAGANKYVLPKADNMTLGGVRIGGNVTVDEDGIISVTDADVVTALGYKPPTPTDLNDVEVALGVVEARGLRTQEDLADFKKEYAADENAMRQGIVQNQVGVKHLEEKGSALEKADAAEAEARKQGDKANADALAAEAKSREEGDEANKQAVDDERQAREQADQGLEESIGAAKAELEGRIEAAKTELDGTGKYLPLTGGTLTGDLTINSAEVPAGAFTTDEIDGFLASEWPA